MTFAGFFGVFQDQYTKAVIEPFQTAHPNIRIEYPIKNSARCWRAACAKSRPTWTSHHGQFGRADRQPGGPVRQLDPEKVPNLADVAGRCRPGRELGPGLTFDSLSILYDTGQVMTPPTSWNDLWRPEYKGKVVMPIADTRGVALIGC